MSRARSWPCHPVEALNHPVTLLALAVWLLNDHVLKSLVPSALTGKLSDVACLMVVPLLAPSILELCDRKGQTTPQRRFSFFLLSIAATALVMATINVLDSAATLYRHGLGVAQWPLRCAVSLLSGSGVPSVGTVQLTMDPTDLWTLPATLVPLWLSTRMAQPCHQKWRETAKQLPTATHAACRISRS